MPHIKKNSNEQLINCKSREILYKKEETVQHGNIETLKKTITTQLKTVYDPEFPIVDIYTLGLIYDIKIAVNSEQGAMNSEQLSAPSTQDLVPTSLHSSNSITVVMTFTTPACPMADMLIEMVKNAIWEKFPDWDVWVDIVFEPLRTIDMIQDEDVKKIFE